MIKGQTSIRENIQDFLCPFENMYITQGSNGSATHKGTMANDVRGAKSGVKEAYYAPCDVKCMKTYPESGQAMWQSLGKVRFANGRVDYATFMTAHDDSFNAKVGQIVKQGVQLGNMGAKGDTTGVHCHIQISQSNDTLWYKNKYGIYQFNNEYDTDDCYFVDNTNILNGMNGNWKKLSDVAVKANITDSNKSGRNYVNLPPSIDKWNIYDINVSPVKANAKSYLNPKKYGGLTYYVYEYRDGGNTAVINSPQFGKVKIWIKDTVATITIDKRQYSNGGE